jgi:hypothetical protein
MTKIYPGNAGLYTGLTTNPGNPNPMTAANYYPVAAPGTIPLDAAQLNSWADTFSAICVAGGQDPYNGNVQLAIAGTVNSMCRLRLNAPLVFYVSSTGSDFFNNGLTSGTAFATIQHAMSLVQSYIDTCGQSVTINVGAGTFAGCQQFAGFAGNGLVTINGAGIASTTINAGSGTCFSAINGSQFVVNNLTMTAPSGTGITGVVPNGLCIYTSGQGQVQYDQVNFAAANTGHVQVNGGASQAGCGAGSGGNYQISGSAPYHLGVFGFGTGSITCGTVNFGAGTYNFPSGFVFVSPGGQVPSFCTFNTSGASFGGSSLRYAVQGGGLINTQGSGTSYFPGTTLPSGANAAGTYV